MFLLILASIFIPVALLGYLSYEKSKSQLTSISEQFLQDNLELNKKQISNFLKKVEEDADKMARSLDIQRLLRADAPSTYQEEKDFINQMITAIKLLQGSYELYVFPKDLDAYPNYRKLINLNKIEPRPEYFEIAYTDQAKGHWFHVWDDKLNKPIFIYLKSVRTSYYYEHLGYIAIQIPDSLIRSELASASSFNNYTFIMVDSNNRVVSHPDARLYNETFFPSDGWTKAETELPEVGWRLIAAVPNKDLTGNISQIKNFTFWIVVVSLLLITIFLLFIIKNFTIPIKDLVNHMEKGVLNHFKLKQEKKDEIGQLVTGYNHMITGMTDLLEKTKEMESDKRNLELQMLNHQINPHFFYNTLDSIKWKAEKAGQQDISVMVTRLANLLRFSLNNGDEWTTVERELAHAENYLDIELIRSHRAFKVYMQIDPEIKKYKMIKLIIQPIVENSIKHGINQLPEGKGKIRITAKRENEDILFIIEDNGMAHKQDITPIALPPETKEHHGIGLSNVHKRLQLHFGNDYGVTIDKTNGFRVMVRHPVIESSDR